MNYSIWIFPTEPLFSELSKRIENLSKQYGSPFFQPHLTIIGNTDREFADIQRAVEQVASECSELLVSLGPISFSTTYYQSVFARVHSTAHLMQLNLDLKKLLSIDNTVYMPHLALIYGDHDMKIREKIASEIHIQATSFVASEIVIIPEKPNPIDWIPVARIPFKSINKS